jgi:hypothetical protein
VCPEFENVGLFIPNVKYLQHFIFLKTEVYADTIYYDSQLTICVVCFVFLIVIVTQDHMEFLNSTAYFIIVGSR